MSNYNLFLWRNKKKKNVFIKTYKICGYPLLSVAVFLTVLPCLSNMKEFAPLGISCAGPDQMPCLFVLRFYGPVNPMGSCQVRSVYLTTRLLHRLSPLSG